MTPEQKQALVGGSLKRLKQAQALLGKGQVNATITYPSSITLENKNLK
jgi:hypothetical protein